MPGIFNITYNNNIVIKELNKTNIYSNKISNSLKNPKEFIKYKNAVINSNKLHLIGKNIGQAINVEDNGNYSMYFVKGYNLMDLLSKNHRLCKKAGWISKELKLEKNLCKKILSCLIHLEINLNKFVKINKLSGDWFLHNLIYNKEKHEIFNVDLEGFYTYNGDSPMCDLKKYIPEQFNACKDALINEINSHIFSIILWNPIQKYSSEIIDYISKQHSIIYNKNHTIDNIEKFIYKIYELDVRCYKPYLPKKIEFLEKYKNSVNFILVLVDNPNYDNENVSRTADNLKKTIRSNYKSYITDYLKDVIIHISDNSVEAENIYKFIL